MNRDDEPFTEEELAVLRDGVAPPPALRSSVEEKRRRRGILRRRRWPVLVAAAALSGIVVTALLLRPTRDVASGEFLLLLNRTATYQQPGSNIEARVREYTAWADDLRDDRQLVIAQRLDSSFVKVGARTAEGRYGAADGVAGFFLIRADSMADAVAIARTSPHVRYGGEIEIRRIAD